VSIPEFLARLEKTSLRWTKFNGVDIRCEDGNCPLTAVANDVAHELFGPDEWEEAAAELDMDFEDAQAIVDAADLNEEFDADLRKQLLTATVERTV
jgi:hypothetical protein